MAPTSTITPPEEPKPKTLPPPQAHRSAGTRFLIAILLVLIALFWLVMWMRNHRTQQPPTAPLHQSSHLLSPIHIA